MLHCSAEHGVKLAIDLLPMSVLEKKKPKYSARHQGNHKKVVNQKNQNIASEK